MIIIVGLGNPGKKFEHTRHNAGFMAIEAFAVKNSFSEFKLSKKYQSLISEKTREKNSPNFNGRKNQENKILLVKPQTFMNDSGIAVKKIISSFKFQISSFIVVHDDIDLPLGKIKFSKDSGAGGHKGIDSIINTLGKKDFIRLKIGVATNDMKAEKVVLKKFTKEEQEILYSVIEKSAEAINYFIKNGLEKTMNEYNR